MTSIFTFNNGELVNMLGEVSRILEIDKLGSPSIWEAREAACEEVNGKAGSGSRDGKSLESYPQNCTTV